MRDILVRQLTVLLTMCFALSEEMFKNMYLCEKR